MSDSDIVGGAVSRLVQLFSAQAELRFPDIDSAALHEAMGRVEERHQAVLAAEAALVAARAALDDEHEALLKLAHRAHAYLRVYAESSEALTEKVEAITLPKPRRVASRLGATSEADAAPKRRGRPRLVKPVAESLFAATPSAP